MCPFRFPGELGFTAIAVTVTLVSLYLGGIQVYDQVIQNERDDHYKLINEVIARQNNLTDGLNNYDTAYYAERAANCRFDTAVDAFGLGIDILGLTPTPNSTPQMSSANFPEYEAYNPDFSIPDTDTQAIEQVITQNR